MTQYVDTSGGVRLAFDTAGEGEPPIVFVHGWSCDRSYFAPQFTHFATRHAVAALDLRGHGESSRPEPGESVYDIETCADDVLAVAGAARFDRPIVVGHSMGGLIALACATRDDAVRAAVLVDPAPILDGRGKAYFARSAAALADDEDGSWRRAFATSLFLPTDTARRDDTIAGTTTPPLPIAAAAWQAMVAFDGTRALERVQVPLLVLRAGSGEASKLREHCPDVVIGHTVGAGHFLQLEVPDQVNPMIERFLAINKLGG